MTITVSTSTRWQYRSAVLSAGELIAQVPVGMNMHEFWLDQVQGYSTAAATRWFQLHTEVVASGISVPRVSIPVGAAQPFAWAPERPGFSFQPSPALCYWYVSTTGDVYTATVDTFWVTMQGRCVVTA